jgi:4a-hydroxytetrahydrobiopterin dehydratase
VPELSEKKCVPCQGGVPALKADEIAPLKKQLPDWEVVDHHHITRNYSFSDFVSALEFVNKVGDLAEQEAHHPDIYLTYGKVGLQLYTHKVDGLTESDFILAAKIEKLPRK